MGWGNKSLFKLSWSCFVQTILAAMPIYGKNLKKLLLRNQKADNLETWYAASGARVLHVSLAIMRLVGSIDLNRVMGDARYSFCRD